MAVDVKEIIIKGKERDLKLAQQLRKDFIDKYNNQEAFEVLLQHFQPNCEDKLIHRLKTEETIDFYKDYAALKEIASKVSKAHYKELFLYVCEEDEARVWINDNGKYEGMVFNALYRSFRNQPELQKYIKPKKNRTSMI